MNYHTLLVLFKGGIIVPELKTEINGKDLLLLFLYFAEDNKLRHRTRLQKMIFLFEEEIWDKFKFDQNINKNDLPDFEANNYGPFSPDIYNDYNFLENLGYINIKETSPNEGKESAFETKKWREESKLIEESVVVSEIQEYVFELTELGEQFVEKKLLVNLNNNQQETLKSYVKKFTNIKLRKILKYVYDKYPDYTKESK